MKSLTKITTSLLILALTAAPAFAGQQAQSSGLITWLFLGFCGLIIVAQLVPAFIMGFGMIKGVFGHAENH